MPIKGFTKDWEAAIGMKDDVPDPDPIVEGPELEEASFSKEQVIELAKKELNFLAGIAIPTVFQYLFPPVLLAAWGLLTSLVAKTRDFSQIALGIPRGHGKTTVIKLFVLYCILFTERKFILVISDTATKAENIIADVIDMLNESNIMRIFGDWKLGIETNRQDVKKFGFRGRNIIIAAIGAGGSVRGLNLKNARPDVMVFDDIQSKECSESQVQSAALERWFYSTARKAKSPHGCLFIFAGNMYPGDNSILKKLKENRTWIKFISGAILADGTALWPELHPLEVLINDLDSDIEAGHASAFFSEVLNDTEAGINDRVDFTAFKKWQWTAEDRPQGKFILIDPSTNKLNSDAVAIGYVEVYDGTPALREVIEEVLSPGNTIRQSILLALRTGTKVIVVESNAYQYSLLYWFNEIATKLNITGMHFVEIYSGGMSKNSRISDSMKECTQGEVILHPSVLPLVTHQIANWNPLKRNNVDNILDLISYMRKAMNMYGHLIATEMDPLVLDSGSITVSENDLPF